jgi:nucleotide-binding universal stress UspA family protein
MFKRVLVPLDGTFYAERALPYVTALARLTGASLILGHVSPPPMPAPAAAARRIAGDIVGRGREPQSSDMQMYLDAQRTLQAFRAPAVSIETIEDSDVVFGVRQLAERSEAGMLVLATHARQGLERRILGSTADGLVEQSHLPLLIIPPHVTIPPTAPTFARVLVPLDGSRVAEHALGLVVGLIQAAASPDVAHWDVTSWQITLYTVVESRVLEADALGYLEEVEARLAALPLAEGVRITKQIVLGSPPGAIVAEANHGTQSPETTTSPFDLVAMATHGRGGLGRMLYGSVAGYVLPRVAVPVLLVHPTDVSM